MFTKEMQAALEADGEYHQPDDRRRSRAAFIDESPAFTPGPWRVVAKHPKNACVHISAGRYDEVAVLYGPSDQAKMDSEGVYGPQPIRDADACLISAAPEMYEALKDCLPLFDLVACGEVQDRVEAAIRKAEGR